MIADRDNPRRQATNFCRRRTHEDVWLPLAICTLLLAGAIVPGFEYGLTIALIAAPAGAGLLWSVVRISRTIRWRREDREDAAYAAAWRAAHRQQRAAIGGRR